MTPDSDIRLREAIRRFALGEIVIVTDNEDRENEGDMICAAGLCTPEKMAFIIRHGCGIVCAPLTRERASALDLTPMVARNNAPLATAFTVSVDAKQGLTTGISATERSATMRALAASGGTSADFVRPGHVFPLIACDGGVLTRDGHTEAATDLCRLAGLEEVGVICELANDDGTVMKGAEIDRFADRHKLARLSVEELIEYRLRHDLLVQRFSEGNVDSPIGPLRMIGYTNPFDRGIHYALVYGNPGPGQQVLLRQHRGSFAQDILNGAPALHAALADIKAAAAGVLVYHQDAEATQSAVNAVCATEEAGQVSGIGPARLKAWHETVFGAQVLRDLNLREAVVVRPRETPGGSPYRARQLAAATNA